MLAVGIDKFNYITITDQPDKTTYLTQLPPDQQLLIGKYHIANDAEIARHKAFATSIEWISITALLGWCVTSPRFQRGWPKLIKKIQDSEPLINNK